MEMIWDETPLTLAELCAAIAAHSVPYTTRDGHIEVRARDIRRLGYADLVRRMLTMPLVDAMDAMPLAPLDAGSLS